MLYQYILILFALKSRIGLKLIYKNNFMRCGYLRFYRHVKRRESGLSDAAAFCYEPEGGIQSEILNGFQRGKISKIKFKAKDKNLKQGKV